MDANFPVKAAISRGLLNLPMDANIPMKAAISREGGTSPSILRSLVDS